MKMISKSFRKLLIRLALVGVVILCLSDSTLAQTSAPISNFPRQDFIATPLGPDARIQDFCNNDGFVNRIVSCMRGVILEAAELFLYGQTGNDGFFFWIRRGVFAAIALAVVTYGYQIMFGMLRKPGPDMIAMFLKVALVITIILTLPYWLGAVMDFMETMLAVITANMGDMNAFVEGTCPYTAGGLLVNDATNALTADDMWRRWDCVLHYVIGIRDDPTFTGGLGVAPKIGLASGIVGFLIAALFSGSIGFMILMIGIIVILTLVFSLLRAVHIYLTAYIGLILIMGVAPIFITCILFKVTRPYFDKWLKNLVSFAVQPIFLFAYLALMYSALQAFIWTSPYSLFRSFTGIPYNGTTPSLGEFLMANELLTYEAKVSWLFNMNDESVDNPNEVSPTGFDGTQDIGDGSSPLRSFRTWITTNATQLANMTVDKVINPLTGANFASAGELTTYVNDLTVGQAKEFFGELMEKALGYIKFTLPFPVIDWEQLQFCRSGNTVECPGAIGGLGTGLGSVIKDIFFAMATIALGCYIMYTMLKYIPNLGHEVIGGFTSFNVAHVSVMPGASSVSSGVQSFGNTMHTHMSGSRGLLLGGGTAGIRGMLSGLRAAPGAVISGSGKK